MDYESEEDRMQAYYNNAELIFQGVPIEMGYHDGNVYYSLSVEKVWKGHADAIVDISTWPDSASCGVTLPLNTPSIIFADDTTGTLMTSLCSGTTEPDQRIVTWLNAYEGQTSSSSSSVSSSVSSVRSTSSEEQIPSLLFRDVPENHSNYKAITFVKNEGIVKGYSDGTYKPSQTINRAEFTKIIIGATLSVQESDTCEDRDLFSDVSGEDWFATYICAAKTHAIIDGYPDGTFKPSGSVNFAEAAKIVVEAFNIPVSEEQSTVWWKPYVFALAQMGGLPPSFSDPNQKLTRGDMAEIIYRVMMGIDHDS